MASGVVDPLQPIEVDADHRQVLAVARRLREGDLRSRLECPAVAGTSEGIREGGVLQVGQGGVGGRGGDTVQGPLEPLA
jgi:hypothetical protein